MTGKINISLTFLCCSIDCLENLHADHIFRTTAEAKGEDLGPVKHFKIPPYFITNRSKAVLLLWFFTDVLVYICGMLAMWPPL